MSKLSERRLVENEVIFRDVNQNIKEFLEDDGVPKSKPVNFYCECSKPDCIERIKLTPEQYTELHKSNKYFVVKPGHEFPEVEQVLDKKRGYELVKKHLQPPKAEEIDLALKTITSKPLPG